MWRSGDLVLLAELCCAANAEANWRMNLLVRSICTKELVRHTECPLQQRPGSQLSHRRGRYLSPRLVAHIQLDDHFFIRCDWSQDDARKPRKCVKKYQKMDGRSCCLESARSRIDTGTIDRSMRPRHLSQAAGMNTVQMGLQHARNGGTCSRFQRGWRELPRPGSALLLQWVELAMVVASGALVFSVGWGQKKQQREENDRVR